MNHSTSPGSELPQLDNSEYTVGWLTALPHEAAASETMLDRFHGPPLKRNENDKNAYTLGSINGSRGEHHVVMTSLPPGGYGTISAATAASHMLSSFPAIKFGLMVGIGGGIWSEETDVRLGDVVVSQPEGKQGGVRLYDFGKETVEGFEVRGHLNSPPRSVLNVMGRLQRKHVKEGSEIPKFLQGMGEKYPKMARPRRGPGFIHQGTEHDRLFHSNYIHQGRKGTCADCDGEQEVQREQRGDEDPEIHYGIIASGNSVIKDARKRDSICGKYRDILCFETEAAGLMNDFPCLVIRGICDYCDSHKNDRWQNYAAATAAAYAKELLSVADPAFDQEKAARETMKEFTHMKES